MADEKIFTIPLREAFEMQRPRRAKRAVAVVKDFLERHMKSENIKIGKSINESIWARGIQKPPRRLRVHALKVENVVFSELLGVDIKPASVEDIKKKQEKKTEKTQKIKEGRKERKKMSIQQELEADKNKEIVEEESKAEEKTDAKTEIKEKVQEGKKEDFEK